MPTFRPCWEPSKVAHSRKVFPLRNGTSFTYWSPVHEYMLMVLGDTLAQASDFTSLLLHTLEKAVAQNSQHALLAEGVAASVLLSRLAMLETQTGETKLSRVILFSLPMCWIQWRWYFLGFVPTETKFSSFWNLILDEKKPLFTTEKFLYQANDESRENIVFAWHVFI